MRVILLVLLTALTAGPSNAFTCQLQEVLDGSTKHVRKTVRVQMSVYWGSETHKVHAISFPSKVDAFTIFDKLTEPYGSLDLNYE